MNKKTKFLTQAAVIAALYVVLLVVFAPISVHVVQVRIAEALSILPFFTPAAIPGLFVGCLLGNLVVGADMLDVIFGSLTTLAAAGLAYRLRKNAFAVPIPAVVLNALVVPFILRYAYKMPDTIYFMAITVFIGQFVSAFVLGLLLLFMLEKVGFQKFVSLNE